MKYRIIETKPSIYCIQYFSKGWLWKDCWRWHRNDLGFIAEFQNLGHAESEVKKLQALDNHQMKVIKEF